MLVLGGSGVVGGAVVRAVIATSSHPVVATHRRAHPLPMARTTWVRYDSAASRAGDGARDGRLDGVRGALNAMEAPPAAVIHCVGASSSRLRVTDTADDEWRALFEDNVLGFVQAYRDLGSRIRRGRAAVVVVGSETTTALPAGNGSYSASKAALEAVVLTLAKEEARYGVRINVVAPSRIGRQDESAGADGRRLITPEQAGEAITAVALDQSERYRSGQIIRLNASSPQDQKENSR
ncbi:SDR family oxidoreductase [Streptomyces sviceus]|uniref:SDR family oxidoreductase n=1 Tax=Streptomyces sviceus TaxID=285530 RepID=UPI0036751D3D